MTDNRYIIIKGKQYDRPMLEKAKKSVQGKSDGKISINDAKYIINMAKVGSEFSETGKRTLKYIRDNFKLSKESDQAFQKKIRDLTTKKEPGKKFAITRNPKDTKQKKSFGPVSQKGFSKRGSSVHVSANKTKSFSPKPPSIKAGIAAAAEVPSKISFPVSAPDEIKPAANDRNLRLGIGLGIIALLVLLAFLYKNYSGEDSKKSPSISEKKTGETLPPAEKEDNSKKEPEKIEPVKKSKPISSPVKERKNQPLESKEFTLYTVKPGDQLSTISKKFLGDFTHWRKIYELNRKIIQDPNLIYPAQEIKIPK